LEKKVEEISSKSKTDQVSILSLFISELYKLSFFGLVVYQKAPINFKNGALV
jgi:hypothetical protein